MSVNTGTINSVELLERALAFEPDAVCTDRPHALHAEALAAGIGATGPAAALSA